MRRFIISDIHSSYDKLISVLKKAGFNNDEDILYSVGDIADRGEKAVETIDFLMSLRDFRAVLGNHDLWLESYLWSKKADSLWLGWNGGDKTYYAILDKDIAWRDNVKKWLSTFPVIRVEERDIITHGGIPYALNDSDLELLAKKERPVPLLDSKGDLDFLEDFLWDRDYLCSSLSDAGQDWAEDRLKHRLDPIKTEKTIWVGHTPLRSGLPFYSQRYHLRAIDTGSVFNKITLVDMDTKEYWQA